MWDSSRPQATPSQPAPSLAAPKLVGRFRCEERLGGEGPFETFRARVSGFGGFDRVYALTCLVPGALGRRPHAAEGVLRAARALSAVKDPRIAAVSDSGLSPGSAFVATEFVHGITLTELREHVGGTVTPRTPLPGVWGAVIAALGAEIAAALAVAHAATPVLVHGALSLGNVMITPQGTVKLIDFGLFAAVHGPAEIAAAPSRAKLAAPELARGTAPDRATDVYALGAVLERLAALEPRTPSAGAAFPPSARSFPAALRPLLRRMMSETAEQRPSASEAEVELRQIAKDARGFDVGVEIGTLVRLIMQLRPTQAERAAAAAQVTDAASGPISAVATAEETVAGFAAGLLAAVTPGAPPPDQTFTDEPTAILDITADGKPSTLSAVLLELRGSEAEEAAAAAGQAAMPAPEAEPRITLPPRTATPAGGFAVEGAPPSLDELPDMTPAPVSPEAFATTPTVSFAAPAAPAVSFAAPPATAAAVAFAGAPTAAFEAVPAALALDADVPAEAAAAPFTPASGSFENTPLTPDGGAIADENTDHNRISDELYAAIAAGTAAEAALAENGEDTESTMVTEEPPSLADLAAPHVAHASGSSWPEEPRPSVGDGTPQSALSNLTSGEIAAGLGESRAERAEPAGRLTVDDDPRAFAPMPAPGSAGAPDAGAPMAAPEAINFAEFSAAMPVRREPKRETVTPPSWQPGDIDGSGAHQDKSGRKGKAAGKARPAGGGPNRGRQTVALAIAALVVGAAALALLVAG